MATRPECSRAESCSRSATLAWRMRSVTGTCSSFSMSAWVRIFIDVSSYSLPVMARTLLDHHAPVGRSASPIFHRRGNAMSSIERPVAHAPAWSAGSVAEVLARTEALIPVLRERADAVDDLRQMLPASVADLKSAGTARLYQPARFGGCGSAMRSGGDALYAVG